MSSRAEALPPLPLPGATRGEVRARFDQDCGAAPGEAALADVVEDWRITRDPDEHRRMVRRAAELLTGQESPDDEPVAVTETRL